MKLFTFLILSIFLFSFVTNANEPLKINLETSTVTYTAKKIGGSHSGNLKFSNGNLKFNKTDVLIAGEFEVDMNTLTNTDIADTTYHKKFLDHLISEDFFNIEKFKTAKFKIKSAVKTKTDHYKIIGDLTIKGITTQITFDSFVTKKSATALLKFDRTLYGIKYGSGKFFQNLGDKVIEDEVVLEVNLKLI